MYPANIIEQIININPKFLLDILYLADKNDINKMNANINSSVLPKKYSKNIFFKSRGSM